MHDKENKTEKTHTVLCPSMSSQITLAAPRLGAEEDVGRAGTKKKHAKTTIPCLNLAARLPRPWPSTELGGVGRTGKKHTHTHTHSKNQHAQPNQTRNTPKLDLKIQKTPETTQGEKPRPQNAENTRNNSRRKTQKSGNYRAWRRRESQLTTAAPLDSSTLRWIPRGNALASWTWRHQEPRTAPVEVV